MPQPLTPSRLPLFVYGTLRPGTPGFATYLDGAALSVRPATVRGLLWLHPVEEYPYLSSGDGIVCGELVEVEAAAWGRIIATLDSYEDYTAEDEPGSLYLRRPVTASPGDGTTISAWTYFWNRPDLPGTLIPGGDWFRR